MIVCIPYHKNKLGLVALLVNIQPQLNSGDLIYIIDNSDNREGLEIVKMFKSSRVVILVEVGKFSIYESWNIGIESMLDNKQEGILILNDDVLLSMTCISNIKKAHNLTEHLALVCETPSRAHSSHRLDPNFKWFSSSTTFADIGNTKWMSGFAFYLKKECIEKYGKFDERFKIWFADTFFEQKLQGKIGILCNEYIYHWGNKSFNYKNKETLEIIDKDRKLYKCLKNQV